jgi:hypothetical protein
MHTFSSQSSFITINSVQVHQLLDPKIPEAARSENVPQTISVAIV